MSSIFCLTNIFLLFKLKNEVNIMENCVFCKIIKGDLPCYKIYENDSVLAFLDISGDIDGHTLVIPKKHCENILDCDNQTLHSVFEAVKTISNHYVNNCGYTGVNVLNANNGSAQQTVFHLHVHIIPRKEADGIDVYPQLKGANLSFQEMQDILKIK